MIKFLASVLLSLSGLFAQQVSVFDTCWISRTNTTSFACYWNGEPAVALYAVNLVSTNPIFLFQTSPGISNSIFEIRAMGVQDNRPCITGAGLYLNYARSHDKPLMIIPNSGFSSVEFANPIKLEYVQIGNTPSPSQVVVSYCTDVPAGCMVGSCPYTGFGPASVMLIVTGRYR